MGAERTGMVEGSLSAIASALREREAALRESQRRLTAVIEGIAEAVVAVFPEEGVWLRNSAWLPLHGFGSFDEVPGHGTAPVDRIRPLFQTYSPDGTLMGPDEQAITRVLRGETFRDMEVLVRRIDKDHARWISYNGTAERDADGRVTLAILTMRDITARKRAEQALQESEERLRLALGATGLGIWTHDIALGTIRLDERAQRQYGLGEVVALAEVVARIHPDDRARVQAAIASALDPVTGDGHAAAEYRVVHADGTVRWLSIEGCVRFRGEGAGRHPVRGFGTSQDITERHEAAEALARLNAELERRVHERTAQLAQLQKTEALGQLTGGIAHDFNNVLAVVLANLELLRKRYGEDPGASRLIDTAVRAAERGVNVTGRLLAFARRQDLQATTVDLAALLRGMADLLVQSVGPAVRIELDLPAGLAPVRVDANQLELAVLNLAVNARDAMPAGGTLRITAAEVAVGSGAGDLVPGRYVRLALADSGAGMDEATLARAVEPFFTTKGVGKGTGLGLAMVHGLAAQSGGALRLASRTGVGTTAELWLPRDEAAEPVPAAADRSAGPPPGEAAAPAPTAPTAWRQRTILAVDDDALVLMGTTAMLEDLGYRVIEALSGAEALAALREDPGIDLVVTDQAMPGLTGLQLAAEVGRLRPGLPVLLATGYAELPEDAGRALARITKPFGQRALAAAIARLLPGG